MNKLELEMVRLLADLKRNYHVTGIKAEFETEGTRLDEAIRLKDVTSAAGLELNIKIGGCEAIKDMFEAVNLGAQRIIGPMVETPYAMQKFIRAGRMVAGDGLHNIDLLANIETITAFENFDKILNVPEIEFLNGIVIGRVDFVGSMGLGRDKVNSEQILAYCLELAAKAKSKGLKVVIGGAISVDSIPFLKAFPVGHLDRFETRKVVFQSPQAIHNPEVAFIKAVEFELLWLKNKRDYYRAIACEDEERIGMMEERLRKGLLRVQSREPVTE